MNSISIESHLSKLLDSNKHVNENNKNEHVKKAPENNKNHQKENTKKTKESNEATSVEISNESTSDIDNTVSSEEILAQKYNTAKTIYDSLTDVRTELSSLLNQLQNTEIEHNVESLEDLDNKSNSLIEKTINIVRKNDTKGLVSINYLNIFFEGLNSLKALKISNDNYMFKIDSIKKRVSDKQKLYFDLGEKAYTELISLNNNYENIANKYGQSTQNYTTNNLQKEIIMTSSETLKSVCAKLTPETVSRLLNI